MPVSLRPVVIIGFGTSGAQIIEKIQQQTYEVFRVNRLPHVRYIAIETDNRYVEEGTPEGSDIHLIRLSSGGPGYFENYAHLLRQFKEQGLELDWVGEEIAQKLIAQGDGAGGVRLAGRLLLWANMRTIYRAVRTATEQLGMESVAAGAEQMLGPLVGGVSMPDPTPMAIVCGTSTGGSFSGAFVDMGYVCQRALGIPENRATNSLQALLLLPPGEPRAHAAQLKANAYGTLLEYEYFAQSDTRYEDEWPGIEGAYSAIFRPYGRCYFISQEYGEGSPQISSVGGLCRLAALKIFCDVIGLDGRLARRGSDHFQHGGSEEMTFGLAAVMHPRYQLAEHAACEAGESLCVRWLEEQNYRDTAGRQYPVLPAEGQADDVRRKWGGEPQNDFRGVLREATDALTHREPNMTPVRRKVVDHAQMLVEDEHHDVAAEFLDTGGTFYGIVLQNRDAQVEKVTKEFHNAVWGKLEESQNFAHAIAHAEALKNVIADTLAFWKRLGIPASHEEWNTRVSEHHIPRIEASARDLSRNARELLVRRDLCEQRILEAIEELKIHLLAFALKETVQPAMERIIGEGLGRYREMVKRARDLLARRRRELAAELADETLPIARVWSRGSRNADLEALREPQPSAKDIAEGGYDPKAEGGTHWMVDRLSEWFKDDKKDRENKAVGRLCSEKIKRAYLRRTLERAREVLEVDLADMRYRDSVNRSFPKVMRCQLRFDSLGEPQVVNRVVAGRQDFTNALLPDLNQALAEDLNADDCLQLPGMEHVLIYYREEAFGGLKRLTDHANLKKAFEEPPRTGIREDLKEIWTELRLAHNVLEKQKERAAQLGKQGHRERLLEAFQLAGDFFISWQQQGGVWQPVEKRPGIELSLSVGVSHSGGRAVPSWTVRRESGATPVFELLDDAGEPNEAGIEEILRESPLMVRQMLEKIAEEVRRLGRDELKRLWEQATPLPVKDYLQSRRNPSELQARYEHYFGGGAAAEAGLIGRIISGDWLAQ